MYLVYCKYMYLVYSKAIQVRLSYSKGEGIRLLQIETVVLAEQNWPIFSQIAKSLGAKTLASSQGSPPMRGKSKEEGSLVDFIM